MSSVFKVIIPARLASTRFPEKVLADIHGKPMIQHVYERAARSGAASVVIATEDAKVAEVAASFGAEVCMTANTHQSGTDRLAEAVDKLGWHKDDIIVNVQGDEPMIPPENIQQVAANIEAHTVNMATLCVMFEKQSMLADANSVKVVSNKRGMALYFSRAAIPFRRDSADPMPAYDRHIGIYAYRMAFLKRFASLEPAPLEMAEKLEQLRALWHGEPIHVERAKVAPGPSIDTPEELQQLLSSG